MVISIKDKIKKAWSIFSDGDVRFVSMEKGVA